MRKFFETLFEYITNPAPTHKTPTGYVVKPTDQIMRVGDTVYVFDRYRFAIPLKGEILKFGISNDGVEVRLHESNNAQYPIGRKVWVHSQQLRRSKA